MSDGRPDLPDWIENKLTVDDDYEVQPHHIIEPIFQTDDPWLSTAQIADEVGVTPQTVRNRVPKLVDLGILDSATGGGGRVYWIHNDKSDWPIPPDVEVIEEPDEATISEVASKLEGADETTISELASKLRRSDDDTINDLTSKLEGPDEPTISELTSRVEVRIATVSIVAALLASLLITISIADAVVNTAYLPGNVAGEMLVAGIATAIGSILFALASAGSWGYRKWFNNADTQ